MPRGVRGENVNCVGIDTVTYGFLNKISGTSADIEELFSSQIIHSEAYFLQIALYFIRRAHLRMIQKVFRIRCKSGIPIKVLVIRHLYDLFS